MKSAILAVCAGACLLGCGVSKESVRLNTQGILSNAYPIRGGRAEASVNSIIQKSFALCKAAKLEKQTCCELVGDSFKAKCEQEYGQ